MWFRLGFLSLGGRSVVVEMKTSRRLNQNMTAFQVKRGRVLKKGGEVSKMALEICIVYLYLLYLQKL